MAEYKLNKTQYPKSIYENVIDTSFTQNTPPTPLEDTISIEQFFDLYMNGLQPERYYTILIKTTINGSTLVFDNNYSFKIING